MAKQSDLSKDNKETTENPDLKTENASNDQNESENNVASEETTEVEKKFTVKPMPGREDMFVIYEGSKQTDFVNTEERCQSQADHLNSLEVNG